MVKALIKSYLGWVSGVLLVWGATWLLLGVRIVSILKNNPQPFVAAAKLDGPILHAVISWATDTLIAYLVIGLFLAFLGQLALTAISKNNRILPTFKSGVWASAGELLCFHGLLYLQVPSSLRSLPLLKSLPIGLDLFILGLSSAACLFMAIRHTDLAFRPLRVFAAMLLVGLPMLLPHDAFRSMIPGPSIIQPNTPRLLLFGVDGLRQDTLERIRPDWAAVGGCTPVTSVPATRKAWLALYGSDPSLALNAVVMPQRSELSQPDRLKSLVEAERQGLRTAFVINDSLTPAFSLQPTPFSETIEPEGGWKYWFTLGYGTTWPVYSWVQNYFSSVETTNAWAESGPFFRDVERALGRNHWTGVHDCRLHTPILPTRAELQMLDPWLWLLHSPKSYQPYVTATEVHTDRTRLTWRSNAFRQYEIRAARLVRDLDPFLNRWAKVFPELSGLFFSDHGESFIPIQEPGKPIITRMSGVHGYITDAENLRTPLHPFGRTTHTLDQSQVYSLFDLRDDMLSWVRHDRPLALHGRKEGWLIQFPATDMRDFTSQKPQTSPSAQDDQGITIREIAHGTYLLPSGAWYIDDLDSAQFENRKKSTALVTVQEIITFNPSDKDKFRRDVFRKMEQVSSQEVEPEAMNREINDFRGARPKPVALNLGLEHNGLKSLPESR